MSDQIISALIAATVAIVTNIISNNRSSSLIAYRLSQLEQKVDKHNNIIERTIILEKGLDTVNKQIDEIHDDIKHLKEN